MSYTKSVNTAGGLSKIWILPLQNFDGLLFNTGAGLFNLQNARNYLQPFYFTPDSGGYKVQWKKGAYQVKIKASIPGSDKDIDSTLLYLETNPFLILALNYNGQYLLFGDHHNYFIYDREQDTGSDFSDLSGFNFELTRYMMQRPVMVVNPFVFYPPEASNLMIVGNLTPRSYAALSYDYSDPQNMVENGSIYNWFIADDSQGTNRQQINGQNAAKYLIQDGDELKYLQAAVKPFNGKKYGEEVLSAYYLISQLPNALPVASDVSLQGNMYPGMQLTVAYTYSHDDNVAESGTIFRFYSADDAQGTNRKLLVSSSLPQYTIKQSDIGKFIVVGVVPSDGTKVGDEAFSGYREALAGVPIANQVRRSGTMRVGNTISATYTYSDPYNTPESGSIISWYIADNNAGLNRTKVSEASTYVLTEAMIGKHLQVGVKPGNGYNYGSEQVSDYGEILTNNIYLTGNNAWRVNASLTEITVSENGPDFVTLNWIRDTHQLYSRYFNPVVPFSSIFTDAKIYVEMEMRVLNGAFPYLLEIWPCMITAGNAHSSPGRYAHSEQVDPADIDGWRYVLMSASTRGEFESAYIKFNGLQVGSSVECRNMKVYVEV